MWKHSFKGKKLVIAIAACSCQAFLLLGYDQGVMSGIIGAENRFGRDFNSPSPSLQGDIVALYDIGCVVGSILTFFIGEKFGRRIMLFSGGAIMIVGTVLLATSTTVAQLIVGRIITGVAKGNGMNSSTAPVYLSECAPANIRGTLLTAQGTVTILGLCIAYWLDYGTSFTDSSIQWRLPLAFQGVFAILLILQVVGLPETPRWLMQHDRYAEAQEVAAAIAGKPVDDENVARTLIDIRTAIEEESKGGPFQYREFFSGGKIQNWRRLVLTIAIELMQQFTGANMINYYAPVVYETTMDLSRNTSLILGGCTSLTYLVGSIIPLFLVDRFGRRPLLMSSAAGLCVCFSMAAILISINKIGAAYAAAAFVFIFQLFLGIGWLPVPWFYPAELNTTRLRTKSAAVASAFNWLAVYAVVKITPIAINNISWRVFIIFAIFNFLWIPIVYCFFPETKNLELEDINMIFEKGGFTGGVFSSRGRTVIPHQHAQQTELQIKLECDKVETV